MAEPQILHQVTACPNCKSTRRVSDLGCAGLKKAGKVAADAFTRLKTEVVPLEAPTIAGVTTEAIATHYDVCADCGTPYCTRSEILRVPVTGQNIPRNNQPFQFAR